MNVTCLYSTRIALRYTQDIHRSVLKTILVIVRGALEFTTLILALVWRALTILLVTRSMTEVIYLKCHCGKQQVHENDSQCSSDFPWYGGYRQFHNHKHGSVAP